MPLMTRRLALILPAAALLAACGRKEAPVARAELFTGETPELRAMIRASAAEHGIPESLLHRVIQRESGYNAGARNGPYYGLMQILPQTAQTMGFRGSPEALLDPEVNLRYAGRYLRGAWLVSGGDEDEAIGWYARGYYYEAKRLGLLEETGLRA
jgi:soluble lytic murein transglycosylase-like protein